MLYGGTILASHIFTIFCEISLSTKLNFYFLDQDFTHKADGPLTIDNHKLYYAAVNENVKISLNASIKIV